MGRFFGKAAGVFFVLYVILTASFLLDILEEIVPKSLVSGVSGDGFPFLPLSVPVSELTEECRGGEGLRK